NRQNGQRKRAADVVGGILMQQRRFLVEKRRADDEDDPRFVEIPGGHVDPGESLEEALRSEMREELGIDVERTKLVKKSLYTASNGERQRIHYFHVKRGKGKIGSKEEEGVFGKFEFLT